MPWKGSLHNVAAWGMLLIRLRIALARTAEVNPRLSSDIISRSQRVARLWRESLRYHKNIAYVYEVNQMRLQVDWFLENLRKLRGAICQ